jgi:hypothetical protein
MKPTPVEQMSEGERLRREAKLVGTCSKICSEKTVSLLAFHLALVAVLNRTNWRPFYIDFIKHT